MHDKNCKKLTQQINKNREDVANKIEKHNKTQQNRTEKYSKTEQKKHSKTEKYSKIEKHSRRSKIDADCQRRKRETTQTWATGKDADRRRSNAQKSTRISLALSLARSLARFFRQTKLGFGDLGALGFAEKKEAGIYPAIIFGFFLKFLVII